MATYIDLDSSYRDTVNYPNACNYIVSVDQVRSWSKEPRQIAAQNPRIRAVEFTQSVECKYLILPYTDITYRDNITGLTVTTHTAALSRLYLDVHSQRYNDTGLINIIDNKIPRARFVLTFESLQFDHNNIPRFVRFVCRMDQVMRFSRNDSLIVNMMQEEGYAIIITDPALPGGITKELQTWILLEITPYLRDADYANHTVGLTQF